VTGEGPTRHPEGAIVRFREASGGARAFRIFAGRRALFGGGGFDHLTAS